MSLLVEINGQHVPLKDCVWVMDRPCGCPCGVMTADWGDGQVFAAEAQAWKGAYPLKIERDRAIQRGFTLRMVTFVDYCESVDICSSCDKCRKKEAIPQ